MQPDYEIKEYRGKFALYWRENGKTRRRSLGTSERDKADRVAREAIEEDLKALAPTFTVKDHWQRYRSSLEGRPAFDTMGFEWKSLEPHFGRLHPDDITDGLVYAYIANRRSQRSRAGTKISDGTIITELNRLASALNHAVEKRLLAATPHIPRPEVPPARDRFLTRPEAVKLIEATKAPHVRLFIALALCTAARRGAILDLTWDRVDMAKRMVDFSNPESSRRLKNRAIVPLNTRVMNELTALQGKTESKYVIAFRGERILSLKTALRTASKDSGVMGVTAHVFRHTAAVWMAEDNVPMAQIAQYLGHKDSRVTELHYARYTPTFLRGAAQALEF